MGGEVPSAWVFVAEHAPVGHRGYALGVLQALSPERLDQALPYIRDWAAAAESLTAVQAVEGFNQTFEIRRRAAEIFHDVDLVLPSTNQVSSFSAE